MPSSFLGAHLAQLGGQTILLNNGLFEFNATNQSQTLTGIILGTGNLQVNAGTLTLSGQNTYTGNTVLTTNGANQGTIIVNGTENAGTSGPLGLTNTIVLAGGALQFSVNNTFDYSSRFSTAAGQQYITLTPAGKRVFFATGLTSSGGSLTFNGPGSLTLAGTNTYSGPTTVNSGTLAFQGPNNGTGSITVVDSASLVVTAHQRTATRRRR